MDGILLAADEFGCEPATDFEGNGSSCIGCACSEQEEDSQAWFWPGFLFLAWACLVGVLGVATRP